MEEMGSQHKDSIDNALDFVSIVLPTYNRKKTLEKAIYSVIAQTYEYWELIIVDDASTDGTENLVKRFICQDRRISYIRQEENRGSNYCRNLGVKKAKGRYIAFLDSDNYWEKEKLEIQLRLIKDSKEEVAFVFCDEIINNGETEALFPERKYIDCDVGEALLITNVVDTNTALVKRTCFEQAGGFDENMPRLQDWELFFRIINEYGYKAIYIPQCLNHNIIQKDSITKNPRKYVDAIFHFLEKYPYLFSDFDLIMLHVFDAFTYGSGEEAYICQKIYEVYSDNPDVIPGILLKLYKMQTVTKEQLQRQYKFYALLYEWKLKNRKLFVQKDITIAIYGLGKWGELFYQDIKELPVNILYGIDQKVKEFHGLPVKNPCEQLEDVDMIVVTIFLEFEEVKTTLQDKYSGRIVSIEELIKEM